MATGSGSVNLTRSTAPAPSASALSADAVDHAYTDNLTRSSVVVSSSAGHEPSGSNSVAQNQDTDVSMQIPDSNNETFDL